MKIFLPISFCIFFAFTSCQATSSGMIGTWEHKGYACGADYRPLPEIKTRLELKRKIFAPNDVYSTTATIPGAVNCRVTAKGSYAVENTILKTEVVSADADCDEPKDFPISMSDLIKETILPKNKKQHTSQEFYLAGDTLYLQLSTHAPARQFPLLPPLPSGDSVNFQVPATNLKPPPSCKEGEKMYEVFSRVR